MLALNGAMSMIDFHMGVLTDRAAKNVSNVMPFTHMLPCEIYIDPPYDRFK